MSASRLPLAVAAVSVMALVPPSPALQSGQPGPPHESALVVGEAPPADFELVSIDGQPHALGAAVAERPLLLLFFRGTW